MEPLLAKRGRGGEGIQGEVEPLLAKRGRGKSKKNHEPLTLNRTFSVLSVISVCQFVKVNVNVKVEIINH